MTSTDALSLHKVDSAPEPMRTLKISARAFIRHDEVRLKDCHVEGDFWISEDIIRVCVLQSTPPQDWQLVAQKLIGMNFKEWKANLEPGNVRNAIDKRE
jgi:hypothetical protein